MKLKNVWIVYNATISMKPESLLQPREDRHVIFPIQHQDIWDMYMQHEKAIWFVNEVDLSRDLQDWKRLTSDEQHFIQHVLAFFAASDGIVMENLASRFMNDVQIAEARSFYAIQMFMENIHSIMYSRLIETYIEDSEEKMKLFTAVQHIPAIREKALWAQRWIASSESFATRLVAFAIVEGVFFSGSFCCIYWLKERGVMPGLCMSNDFIARDEGLHTTFAVLLYTKYISNPLCENTIHQMINEAVDIEKRFIIESLPCSVLGMNASMMSQYIEYIANRLANQLGYERMYPDAQQPFGFMDRICIQSVTNFFEGREVNYQKEVDNNDATTRQILTFDDDF